MLGFVVLVTGFGCLGAAISYAIHPTEGKLSLIRPLTLAGVFAALCSTAAGLAMALKRAAESGGGPKSAEVLMAGLAEACVPLFVAFGFLAVGWVLVAVGLRRQV
jgi:hypothetical protein